jgi:apolipoprotein N-acyltransferase
MVDMKLPIYLTAGLISSTAFSPFEFWISAFIGLFLWFFILARSTMKVRLIGSYLFGLGLLLPAQQWTGIYVGSLPWLALCFMQAVFFIVPAIFFPSKGRYRSIIFASSYVLVELLLRTIPFTGFGWTRLSYTQTEGPISSLYSLGGVVLVAWSLALLVALRSLLTVLIALTLLSISTFTPEVVQSNGQIRLALIQGGVSELGFEFNSKPREVFLRHLDETQKLKDKVDLIIWPENAVDIDIKTNPDVYQQIVELAKNKNTPLLVGGVTKAGSNLKNQSMLFTPELSQVYTKRYLTPFGEYLPIRSIASKFSPYADEITDFVAGKSDQIFKIDSKSFQVLICYEVINDVFRDQIESDFIIVQTNNATFGDTAQLDQELVIAKVRAMETGRNIAYVSTTGVTSFILPNGQISSELDKFEQATLIEQIKLVTGSTITQRIGFLLEPIFMLSLIVLTIRRAYLI